MLNTRCWIQISLLTNDPTLNQRRMDAFFVNSVRSGNPKWSTPTLKGSRFISVVGCNHQRTVSAFNQGVYILFSPTSLTFKAKVLKKK